MSSLAELQAGFLFPRFSGIKRVSARLMAACADHMVGGLVGGGVGGWVGGWVGG